MAVTTVINANVGVSGLHEEGAGRTSFGTGTTDRAGALPGTVAPASTAAAGDSATAASTTTATTPKTARAFRIPGAGDVSATTRVEARLAGEVQVLQQAGANASEAASILQTANTALTAIDAVLTRMEALAEDAQESDVSDAERAILNNEFAALRAEIDTLAGNAEFSGRAILDGANTFTAASPGSNIQAANGVQALSFDSGAGDSFVATGNTIAVSFDATTDTFTVTNLNTGLSATSEVVAAAPGAGETNDIVIGEFGLTIQINENFSLSTDITTDNSFTVSGSASANLDLTVRIGSGTAGASDEVAAGLSRVRVATLSEALGSDTVLSAASAARAEINVEAAQAALDQVQTDVAGALNRVGAAVAAVESGLSNLEAANATIADLAHAADSVQGALHDVVAEAATALLGKVSRVNQIKAGLESLSGLPTVPLPAPAPVSSPASPGADAPAGRSPGTSGAGTGASDRGVADVDEFGAAAVLPSGLKSP